MEKIILIYPSRSDHELTLIPPLSLVYIATPLKGIFKINIIDQRVDREWRLTLRNELMPGTVICAGISCMTGPQISGAIEAAKIIKDFSPSVPIVWGGVHPSLLPEETIRNEFVDIIVIGDGEETFKELVEAIQQGGDKKSVKGIAYKEGDSVVRTPEREQFPIDRLEDLAYDLVEIERYRFPETWINGKVLPVITSRGCPYRCAFCYNTQFSQRQWTALSPEQTVSMMTNLMNEYHVKGVFLLDDNFFVNLGRARRICELLIKNNVAIGIHNANCRVDTLANMDDEFLGLMKKAGFHQIYIGVESGSNDILRKMKKDITVEQVLLASSKLKRVGIKPFYSFMAGFPFETIEDIKNTVFLMNDLLKENPNAIVLKLQLFTPYPGTELFQYVSNLGMKFPKSLEGWSTYHFDRINYNGFSPRHYKFLEDMHFYTSFLDQKFFVDYKPFLKFISKIYSKILKFRIAHGLYPFRFELYPLRAGQKIRNWLSH
jgi:anaerobic magnesium-protoporphyrin IX monomethyl ester cyclase